MTINAASVAQVMGGERTLGHRIGTVTELRRAMETGLPVGVLDQVVRHVTRDDRSAADLKYRIVPQTTLRRRSRLSADESQRVERIARLIALAEQVWEDRELAYEFLSSAQPQLDGERPIDLARSDLGTRQVETLLMKLEYALPA
ncbi:MAG TPA: antitoxin Xre/MbcA/ParS toxin-binding domain-containing protein [Longimicrobium sp.]|nr:antitoxin Xre/MbcA/ParS toxin-binding domain-containing protein [Longimicrobium sp.]